MIHHLHSQLRKALIVCINECFGLRAGVEAGSVAVGSAEEKLKAHETCHAQLSSEGRTPENGDHFCSHCLVTSSLFIFAPAFSSWCL